jgi:hypothetical protein
MKQFILSTILFSLISCGGGGGGESDVPFFGGIWVGQLSLVKDTCEVQPLRVDIRDTVNQVDTEIVLNDANKTYSGVVEGTDGFVVFGQTNGTVCQLSDFYRYSNIKDNFADVEWSGVADCDAGSGLSRCEFSYIGTATRIES